LEHFGFTSGTHQPPTTPEEFQTAVDQLEKLEETERTVQSLARKEQSFLRRRLFKTTTHKCTICGKEYPVDVLVAAHIKRRSACTRKEKLDADNIVMPVCKIGCDELYESGYISVDDAGKVLATQQKTTPALKGVLESVKGRVCSAFKSTNAHYFAWHRKTVFKGD
jgi:predicted restriction endonuclease